MTTSPIWKRLTKLCLLGAAAIATTALGTSLATPRNLSAAEPDQPAMKLAAQANSDFACDLYRQLAAENAGENLFFSPYSVSIALTMTAEGARGGTALQMGKVLRFPEACRNQGNDATSIPWQTSPIHAGLAELTHKLQGGDVEAKDKATEAKLDAMRELLKAKSARLEKLRDEGLEDEALQEYFQAVNDANQLADEINQLAAQVRNYELQVANALWGEQAYPFRKEFVGTIQKHYAAAGIFPVDFKNQPDAERKKINAWVEGQTKNRIRDLLPNGSIDAQTRLVLTNAIYFKSDWATPFEPKHTAWRPFTKANGDTTPTQMMHAPELEVALYGAFHADGTLFDTPLKYRPGGKMPLYPAVDGFAMVALPYRGGDLSMVVIAPNKADGLAKLETALNPQRLQQWIGQLQRRKTQVYLPKFKLETDYTLGDADEPKTLQKMGMVRAFVKQSPGDGADFSGMSVSADPIEQLYVGLVCHKAFLEVNEVGTEAAAASVAAWVRYGEAVGEIPFVPEFKADRPFLFLIRENATGSILFMGRMVKPAGHGK